MGQGWSCRTVWAPGSGRPASPPAPLLSAVRQNGGKENLQPSADCNFTLRLIESFSFRYCSFGASARLSAVPLIDVSLLRTSRAPKHTVARAEQTSAPQNNRSKSQGLIVPEPPKKSLRTPLSAPALRRRGREYASEWLSTTIAATGASQSVTRCRMYRTGRCRRKKRSSFTCAPPSRRAAHIPHYEKFASRHRVHLPRQTRSPTSSGQTTTDRSNPCPLKQLFFNQHPSREKCTWVGLVLSLIFHCIEDTSKHHHPVPTIAGVGMAISE